MIDFERKSDILITCPKALPPYLSGELNRLGFPVLGKTASSVETRVSLKDTMILNLHLRTANRIFYRIKTFPAKTPDDLYRETFKIPWEQYFDESGMFSVTSTVFNPTVKDNRYANLKCKDAIADRFVKKCGRRPDSGASRNGAVVHLFWRDDSCSIYLDTSGEPLTKRGYRKIPLQAPVQETIAAAVVMATGWDGPGNFINPMCGSGTFAIEAALIGLARPPGLLRSRFGFMHLKGFVPGDYQSVRRKARTGASRSVPGRIIASDNDPHAVEAAHKNAVTAGVDHLIEFETADFSKTTIPEGRGVVLLNPEYGQRMGGDKPLEQLYKGIGDFFKQRCSGYTGYIFTGNLPLSKKVGLRASKRIPFFSSKIECRLLAYDLYSGSRRPLQE